MISLMISLISWGKSREGWSDMGSLFEENWINNELEIGIILSTVLGQSDSVSDLGQDFVFERIRDLSVNDLYFKVVPESRSRIEGLD